MKKRLKSALTASGGVLVVCMGAILSIYIFLRSPAGSTFLLSQLNKAVARNLMAKIEYTKGSIDPFSWIHFEDLKIIQNSKPNQIEARIKTVDIRYSFSLLSRTLMVDQILIDQPTFTVHTEVQTPQPTLESPIEEKNHPFAPQALEKYIAAIPIQFIVKKFSLVDLNLYLNQKSPDSETAVTLKDASLNFHAHGASNRVIFSGDFQLGESNQIYFTSLSNQQKTVIQAMPYASAQWTALANLRHSQWTYEIQPTDIRFGLKDLNFLQSGENAQPIQLSHMNFDSVLKMDLTDKIRMNLNCNLRGINSRLHTLKPAHLEIKSTAELSTDLEEIKTLGTATLNQVLLADFDFFSQIETPGQFKSQGNLSLQLDPRLADILKDAAPIKKWKLLRADIGIQGQAKTSGKSRSLKLQMQTKLPPLSSGGYTISLAESLTFKPSFVLDPDKTQIDLEAQIPSIEISRIGKILNSNFSAQIQSKGLPTKKDWDISADFKQEKIILASSPENPDSPQIPPLGGFKVGLRAGLQRNGIFSLKELKSTFNNSMAQLTAEATGNSNTKNFQTQGSFVLNIPNPSPDIEGQSISGKVTFPWALSIYRGQNINLTGNVFISGLSWTQSPSKKFPFPMKISGISGKFPVSEQWIWDGKKMQFAHLITQNPFERVDFERLQPMLQESDQINIDKITYYEKTYGPFQGFFSMRQNMFFAHKFDFQLGSGRTYGEMYFDTYPSNIQLGILARMTGLNLSEILPDKYRTKTSTSDEKLSGRSGMVINLSKGSVDGRIDITEIGGKQLITLMNVMDPKYENEQMNRARSALGIVYPSFVQMSFQKGYMDMGIQLDGILSKELNLRGIPISSWISGATADMKQKREQKKQRKGSIQ